MGIVNSHAQGRDRKFFVMAEAAATPGAFVKPTSAGAARMLSAGAGRVLARTVRDEARQSRSLIERITGKSEVHWDCEGYLIPSGTAGTPPDAHLLYKAVMGGYTNTPSTSDAYALANSQAPDTLSIVRHMSNVWMEAISGAWVDEMTISQSGGDSPRVKFSGGAMGYAHTGTATTGAVAAAMTATPQNQHDYRKFQVGSEGTIDIGSVIAFNGPGQAADDNSGAGFQLTSVNYTTGAIVWADANVTADAGDVIIPYTPAETVVGSPLSGTDGSVSINPDDDSAIASVLQSFEVKVKQNVKPIDDESFQTSTRDVLMGYREVSGSITFRARKDQLVWLGYRDALSAPAITIALGTSGGKICTITMANVEFDWSDMDVPEADEATITLPFMALGTMTSGVGNEDEITITFT